MKSALRLLTAAALTAAVTLPAVAVAQEDYIKHRKTLMQANGSVMGLVGKMAQGTVEFDAAAATGALEQLVQTGRVYSAFFPAGSGEGDTRAAAAIFDDPDGFQAAAMKLSTDAEAAVIAVQSDGLAGLQASLQAVGGNCQACHQAYRSR